MPLTKTDLQQIGQVVDQRLDDKLAPIKKDLTELKSDVGVLKKDVGELKSDVSKLKSDVGTLKTNVNDLQKDMKEVKSRVKKIEKTTDVMIDMFDREGIKLTKRVTRIENHLDLPPIHN